MLSFQFKQCFAPSIQPRVELLSRKGYGTPSAGEAHPTGVMVGRKIGDVPLDSRFILERSGNLPLGLITSWLQITRASLQLLQARPLSTV